MTKLMEDIFELPVLGFCRNDYGLSIEDSSDDCGLHDIESPKTEKAIIAAINSHDTLTEQNKQLKDRISKLEKAADSLLWECITNKDVQDSDAWRDLEKLI